MESKKIKIDKVKIGLILIVFISGICIIGLINRNNKLSVEKNILEQNQIALNDSLRVSKNKVGDLEFSKAVLVSEKKDLKDLNSDLSEELKKEKGKVFELTEYVANIKPETEVIEVVNTLTQYPDGVNGLEWDYEKFYDSDNFRKISGVSKFKIDSLGIIKPLETNIFKDEINFNVVQGLREKDGVVEMFVRSDYPGFSLSELNSVIIDPEKHPVLKKFTRKRRFGLGVYGGYGATVINSTVQLGPQVGIGLTYDFIQF